MKKVFSLSKMKYFLLLLIISFGYSPVKAALTAPNSDYILILNPDAETCAWSEMMIPSIKERLQVKYPDLRVEVQYMYGLGITTEEGVREFKNNLFAKYSKTPKYLLLFEADMYAWIRNDMKEHWGNDVPTIVVAREDYIGPEKYYLLREDIPENERIYFKKLVEENQNLTVVYNPFDIDATIQLMTEMYPDMSRLLFVSDARYISARIREDVREIIEKKHPGIELVQLTPDKLTTDELINIFIQMPKGSGVLYFTWFNNEMTADKDLILQTNAYRVFSLYTKEPVFTINDVGLKESGMLGGVYTRYEQVDATFMNAMDKLVNGTLKDRFIACPTPIPSFNYLAIQTHNMDLSQFPKNSYLYHRPLTFLERNGKLILWLAVILFLSIISSRIILLIKTRKMQNKEIKLLEKYGDLFNNMPIGYRQDQLLFNEKEEPVDMVVMEVNPGFEQQIATREQSIGKTGPEVYTDLLQEMLNIYNQLLKDKTKKVNMPYYHKESDKYFSMIISPSSTPGCMDIFFVDTSELMKTQQLLRTVNKKLTMSLDIANITPWKWDLHSDVLTYDINKAITEYADSDSDSDSDERQLSISKEQYFDKIHPEDTDMVHQAYFDLIEGKIPKAKVEFRICRSDASFDWVESQAAVEKRDKDGKPVSLIGSSLIITERKQIEEELRNAKDKAEESNRLKSAFLANMSHEIRTPLNAIVGFSNILATTEEEDEKQEYINIIETNNTLLLQLVSDILDLSKFEAGTMESRYTDVDINALMEEQIDVTKEKAADGVDVLFEKREPECFVKVEKVRLAQVLVNLLANAAKFTEKGSIRFGYEDIGDKKLRFYVTDTGRGISAEQIDKIFTRFVKLDHFVQGTGLGLSICQTIVEHFGGEIGVDSVEGEGSTFWFTFPYSDPNKPEDKPANEDATEEKPKLKVLIAEDNLSNFELFEFVLKRDFEIIHAWDGKEAIEMFKTHQPHIVLMDINMPKMNGYEATKEIRRLSKDVPIIAVTAYAFSTDEQQIRKNGFNAYSPKPLNAHNLKKQMSDLLGAQAGLL